MKAEAQIIAKNASVLMASQLVTWAFSLLLTVFLPRYLGARAVGQFHLAGSLWAIIGIAATFGMDILLTKEIARAPAKTVALLGTGAILRAFLYLLGTVGLIVYVRLAGYPLETLQVIAVVGITAFVNQLISLYSAALSGLERMEYISLGGIVSKAILTIVSIAVLLLGQGVIIVAAVATVATLVNLLIVLFYLRRLHPVRLHFDAQLARWMVKSSFPYFTVTMFLVLYMQVDIVIISLLVDETSVGWYGAADQLFGTLLFIPTIFMTAVFPALSRLHGSGSTSSGRLMRKSFELLLLAGIPIGLGLVIVADQLVVLLFGIEFANSGPILAVMGVVLILTYQNILLGRFYISIDRQRDWTWIMVAATVATVPLDLILIPWCQAMFGNGAIGGALAFVVTEAGMLVVGLRFLPGGIFGRSSAWFSLRALIAGTTMMVAIWWARDHFIAIPIILGAVIYSLSVFLLQLVPPEDWLLIKDTGRSLFLRLRRQQPQPVH